jgi:SOS-response transcriptional repressor LexA
MARHIPNNTPELAERLVQCRRDAGMGQIAFARHLGVPQSSLASWESGKRPISRDTMLILADKLGGAERDYWLRTAGVDLSIAESTVEAFKKTFSYVDGDMMVIPIRSGAIAAGQPLSVSEDEYEGKIALPLSDLPESRNYLAARVEGNSMAPRIMAGDIVIIDTRRRPPKEDVGQIVAARDDDGCLTIKTLAENGGRFFLLAGNPDYKPLMQPISPSNRWAIAGRVVKWIGKPGNSSGHK